MAYLFQAATHRTVPVAGRIIADLVRRWAMARRREAARRELMTLDTTIQADIGINARGSRLIGR